MRVEILSQNKKASRKYEILDRFEAGIVLQGTEVKSVREHKINLEESYARIKDGELWLENCRISPYSHGNISNHEPTRPRKLLLHRREIDKLLGKTLKKGYTVVPVSVYLKEGKVKVEIALARGKQIHGRKEDAKKKDLEREVAMELKRRRQ